MKARLTRTATYDPNALLDALKDLMKLKNDAALSLALDIQPPVLSKIRHYRMPVSGAVLLRMHEASSVSVTDLQAMMGDRRAKFRLSSAQGRPQH
jgi:hypothetical protein